MNDIQTAFLIALKIDQTPVSIYLKSGIRLVGQIKNFDEYTITLSHGAKGDEKINQLVYKHVIATVMRGGGKSSMAF